MTQLLIALLLAHIVGDFVLQPDKWVKDKEQKKIKSRYLPLHILVHLCLMVVATGCQLRYWLGILVIAVSHYVLDLVKLYWGRRKRVGIFFLDQFLHIGVLLLVVWAYYPHFRLPWEKLWTPECQLLLGAVLSATFVVSVVIKVLLQKWSLRLIKTDKSATDASTNKAGQYIGILERLFVFYFVTIGFWGGIGFLLTAKSIFRFNDLSRENDRNYTEYIIIGTLVSFASAMFIGLSYNYLKGLFE
ncbi:MAG: DUF3307 domain-containing protein [Chitinophagaceae bacterium]